ncbi:hypothetical protein O9993_23230 [Vibrio lentus]|nr:hypothetical protein [Vibrio lentus]
MPLAASIENDVVRKHWNGNFSDMLMASFKTSSHAFYRIINSRLDPIQSR